MLVVPSQGRSQEGLQGSNDGQVIHQQVSDLGRWEVHHGRAVATYSGRFAVGSEEENPTMGYEQIPWAPTVAVPI